MPDQTLHTIVVGAGQAGLCASYYLSQHGIEHLVLERARIGERWRSERWDSLRFQFPNRYVRLPGFPYDGNDPEGFMHRDGVVRAIERYADHISAPVRAGVDVQKLQVDNDGVFILTSNERTYRAHNVILATGPYQRTLIPSVARDIPPSVHQLPASAYVNPDALPAGGVLVVGAGGSGVQITEDLLEAGRDVWLCVGNFKRIPRSYRGRDIMDWLEDLNLTSEPTVIRDASDHSPLLTGVDGGYEVDLRRVVAQGGTLLGRLEGVDGTTLILGDQLQNHMQAAEAAYDELVNGLESALQASGQASGAPVERPPVPGPLPADPPLRLALDKSGITSIIWATGYGVDFSWVDCGDFLPDTYPVQERGIGTLPGLYFLGLWFMHSARSSFFWGVGEDAEHVVSHLAGRPY